MGMEQKLASRSQFFEVSKNIFYEPGSFFHDRKLRRRKNFPRLHPTLNRRGITLQPAPMGQDASHLVDEIGGGRFVNINMIVLETTFHYFCNEFKDMPIENFGVAVAWIQEKSKIYAETPDLPRGPKRRARRVSRVEIWKNAIEPLKFRTQSSENERAGFISRAQAWFGGHKCLTFYIDGTPELKTLKGWTRRASDSNAFIVTKPMGNDAKLHPLVIPGDTVIQIGRVTMTSTESTDSIQFKLDAYAKRFDSGKSAWITPVKIFRKSGTLMNLCKSLPMPPPTTKIIIFEKLSGVFRIIADLLKPMNIKVHVLKELSTCTPQQFVDRTLKDVKSEYQSVHPKEEIKNENILYFESRSDYCDVALEAKTAIVDISSRKSYEPRVEDWIWGMNVVEDYFRTGELVC